MKSKDIALELGVCANTVGKWRRRFAALRLDGLYDEPRSGAPRSIDDARIEALIARTLESRPAHAVVLCVDEKSQIQALDRSQPMLPMRPG